MVFVAPPMELQDLAEHREAMAAAVVKGLRRAAGKAAARIAEPERVIVAAGESFVSLDSLTVIGSEWEAVVDGQLMPMIDQMYTGAAVAWTATIRTELPGWDTAVIPPVRSQAAEAYLAGARNRLVGIGDELWADARTGLLEGFAAGEDIPALAARVSGAAGVAEGRASVIARTEAATASNAGAIAIARELGVPMSKIWMAVGDGRTRPSHDAADGQQVSLDEPFDVGGAALDIPGDPAGPAAETIQCRCSLGFDVPDDAVAPSEVEAVPLVAAGEDTTMPKSPSPRWRPRGTAAKTTRGRATAATRPAAGKRPLPGVLTAANGETPTGAMVALIPTDEDAQRLALDGGEPAEELHLTLAYLGEAADWSTDQRTALLDALQAAALPDRPVTGEAFGVDFWNADSDNPSWNLQVGGADVEDIHYAVWEQLLNIQGEAALPIPEQHRPWAAHVCLAYSADTALLAPMLERLGPITFDRVRVVFADEAVDIPLDTESAAEEVLAAAEAPAMAVADREPLPLARSRGRRGAAARAVAPRRAFQGEGECPPGMHLMPDGTCMPDEEMPIVADNDVPQPAPVPEAEHFHTIVEEGVSTGARRFAEGSLTWRIPPFAFHWEYSSAAHGAQMLVAQVGLITRVVRDDNIIHFYGTLDLDSEKGVEYARQLAAGFARWSSIGLDEEKVQVEVIWPDDDDDDDDDGGDPLELLFAEPDEVIIQSGNVGEITAVSVPALADATVEPTQLLLDALAERGITISRAPTRITAFTAVAPHDTGTTDEPWDEATNERRLPSPMSLEMARAGFAWIDENRVEDGQVVKDACKFLHHMVGENGRPGVANLEACSTGIGILNGGRGVDVGQTEWAGDRQGIFNHLAGHLRDAGREPPPLDAIDEGDTVLVAASHTIVIPDVPPAWWFDEPVDIEVDGALTITDEGRIYGRVAPAGVRHRGYRGQDVYVPMGNVDYDRWMNKQAIVDLGEGRMGRINAGVITGDCGHCPPWVTSDTAERMQHYDNSCSVFAKARVGEWTSGSKKGVWIAGALEPFVTPDRISRALGCDLSGDWGPHPQRRGWKELVAALLVPVAGFTEARDGAKVTVRDHVLVASAVPVRFRRSAGSTQPDTRPVLERLARQIGRDRRSRMAALHARVHSRDNGRKEVSA